MTKGEHMRVVLGRIALALIALTLAYIGIVCTTGNALADGKPARSETLSAGPYTIVMTLSEDPPQVEDPIEVTIVSHDTTPLTGHLTAKPGLGTDGVILHAALTDNQSKPGTLVGTFRLPVRGAWQLIVDLDGPQGHGTASLAVVAAIPGAIPPWLGWLVGLSPLVGCVWLFWWLARYRRSLLKNATGDNTLTSTLSSQ